MARKPQVAVEPRPMDDGRFKPTARSEPTRCTTGSLTPSSGAANSPAPSRPNS